MEKIIKNIKNLLTKYDYEYDSDYIADIVDTWADNKAPLIELFKKHPNYVEGEYLIAFETEFKRTYDTKHILAFEEFILHCVQNMQDALPPEIDAQRIEEHKACLPDKLFSYFINNSISSIRNNTLTPEQAAYITEFFPNIKPHTGEKTSRVINKICTYLGYARHPDYNKEFAKYADAINPLTIKRHIILSINPMDYLTMSFGNSWASCHTIDIKNKRGMPNSYSGQYSSGTLSYMLDSTSMVLYTVDENYHGTEFYTQPKINRQMFHFGEDKLIQGRLYPQDNDGNGDAYVPYRQFVQQIMSEILGIPNLWTLTKGTEAASKYIISKGTHYRDYEYYNNCTLSVLKDSENTEKITVGHDPICPCCGREHDYTENICCEDCLGDYEYCSDCGERLYQDDIIWVNDEPYCRDCVNFCDECDEYVHDDTIYVASTHRYVCRRCLEDEYTYCEKCGEYYPNDETRYIESEGIYVCTDCLEEYYVQCHECGEYVQANKIVEINDEPYCSDCAEKEEEEDE